MGDVQRRFGQMSKEDLARLACCRDSDGLDLGVLPPVTIFARPYRCSASGLGRYSSVEKPSLDRFFRNLARGVQISANMCKIAFLHTVRKREVFQSRDCLLSVVENGAELPLQSRNLAVAVAERNTMSLDALAVELLEPSENWKYRLRSSCSEILCTSLQNKQSTFLNDLTDTTLDNYSLLSLPDTTTSGVYNFKT